MEDQTSGNSKNVPTVAWLTAGTMLYVCWKCNPKQAWLSAAMKANTREAGADVKENGLFAEAGHLEDGGLHATKPISPSQWSQRYF